MCMHYLTHYMPALLLVINNKKRFGAHINILLNNDISAMSMYIKYKQSRFVRIDYRHANNIAKI